MSNYLSALESYIEGLLNEAVDGNVQCCHVTPKDVQSILRGHETNGDVFVRNQGSGVKGTYTILNNTNTKCFVAYFDMPGCNKEDIIITVGEDNTVEVSAKRMRPMEGLGGVTNLCSTLGQESVNKYLYSFAVADMDVDNIKAQYDNGVLCLMAPYKAKGNSAKTIKVM